MNTAKINGLSLCYEIIGRDTGKNSILISGLGSPMTRWNNDFCERLVEQGYRVIRFDNRDVGQSQRIDSEARSIEEAIQILKTGRIPKGAYTLLDMAKDVIALMDELKIEKADLMGRSMGGIIAQIVAAEFPERVQSITLIMTTSLHPDLPQTQPDVLELMLQPSPDRKADPEAYKEHALRFSSRISGSLYPLDKEEEWKWIQEENKRADPPRTLGHLIAIMATGFDEERFQKIKAPCLVIHGTEDPIFPIECGRDLAKRISNARLLEIEGMGHDLPQTVYTPIMDAFLLKK